MSGELDLLGENRRPANVLTCGTPVWLLVSPADSWEALRAG